MDIIIGICLFLILTVIGILYDRYNNKLDIITQKKHTTMVNKYFINEKEDIMKGINNKKPNLWIYIDFEKNARHWMSFYSRSNNCLNQPYLLLTIQSIIDKCGDSFNVCLIDDKSFERILEKDEFDNDLPYMANPIKRHAVQLGILKLIYKYGGMTLPANFICKKNFKNLYHSKTNNLSDMFCGEINNKDTLNGDKVLSPMFLGAKKNSQILLNYITFTNALIHGDFTNEMDICGKLNNYLQTMYDNSLIDKINSQLLGFQDKNGKDISLDKLMSMNTIVFDKDIYGIYIPNKELLKRHKYKWFVKLLPEEVLESDTNIGRYLLLK